MLAKTKNRRKIKKGKSRGKDDVNEAKEGNTYDAGAF